MKYRLKAAAKSSESTDGGVDRERERETAADCRRSETEIIPRSQPEVQKEGESEREERAENKTLLELRARCSDSSRPPGSNAKIHLKSNLSGQASASHTRALIFWHPFLCLWSPLVMMEPLCDATVTHSFLMSVAEEGVKQNSSSGGGGEAKKKKNTHAVLLCSCTGTREINEFE